MYMALTTNRWTRADLDRLPEDDGNKYEILDGELLVTPAPRPAHEYIIDELGNLLSEYCRRTGIGRAFHGKSAVVTERSHLEPDIVVRARVVPPPKRWDDVPTPFLIVEVLSDSTRRRDLVKKRAFYMANGIPEYWIVDGDSRTVRVVTPSGERIETQSLRWHPAGAADPFNLDVAALFDATLGPAQ
jgi:Uma2 family endonuclease